MLVILCTVNFRFLPMQVGSKSLVDKSVPSSKKSVLKSGDAGCGIGNVEYNVTRMLQSPPPLPVESITFIPQQGGRDAPCDILSVLTNQETDLFHGHYGIKVSYTCIRGLKYVNVLCLLCVV